MSTLERNPFGKGYQHVDVTNRNLETATATATSVQREKQKKTLFRVLSKVGSKEVFKSCATPATCEILKQFLATLPKSTCNMTTDPCMVCLPTWMVDFYGKCR